MRQLCTYCGTIAEAGTALCPNRRAGCPPGTLTVLFDSGERFDDLEILRRLGVFQMAALYQARRGKTVVFLMIAHRGYEDRLKQMAQLLDEPERHPALPALLSASSQDDRAYNKFSVGDSVKYYAVFRYVEGKFLREMAESPFSPLHAGWLAISLGDALAWLHLRKNRLLLNLSPDTVLVRLDKENIPRPIIFDLTQSSPAEAARPDWFKRSWRPAYLAPEQIKGTGWSAVSDVYALGLLLYELLAGQPAIPFRQREDQEVRALVTSGSIIPLMQRRPELPQGVSNLLEQALHGSPAARPPDMRTFAKGLRVLFGDVPPEKSGLQIDRRILAVIVVILLAILLLTVLWLLTQS